MIDSQLRGVVVFEDVEVYQRGLVIDSQLSVRPRRLVASVSKGIGD